MSRYLKSGLIVFAGLLLGRLAGFARDILAASVFGLTRQGDVVGLVVSVPDTLIGILVGGAMGAALIPEFKRRPQAETWALFRQVLLVLAIVMALITWLLTFGALWVVRVTSPGYESVTLQLARPMIQICLWAIPLTAMSAAVRAFLQSHDRFAIASLSTLIYNLTIVAGMLLFTGDSRLVAVAYCAIVGAGLSLLMQLWEAWGIRSEPRSGYPWLIDRRLVIRYFQALGAGGLVFLLPVGLKAFASLLGAGFQARAGFAVKIVELPMGAVLTVVSVALYPAIAEKFANPETQQEGSALARSGMKVILALGLPIALGMGFFGADFANVIYAHGKVSADEARAIGGMASVMMFGLIPQALNTMVVAAFDSLRDMRSPFYVSLFVILGFVVAGLFGRPILSLTFLGAAYAGAHWSILIALLIQAKRKHGIEFAGALFGGQTLRSVAIVIVVFFGLAIPGNVLILGSVQRVLVAIFFGVIAGSCGLWADPATRARFIAAFKPKAGASS